MVLCGQPQFYGLIPITGNGAPPEKIAKAHVVRPLATVVLDNVQMSDPVPRPSFKNEDLAAIVARVTAIDPSGSLQPRGDRREQLARSQAHCQIDNRFSEQTENRRGPNQLNVRRDTANDLRHLVA